MKLKIPELSQNGFDNLREYLNSKENIKPGASAKHYARKVNFLGVDEVKLKTGMAYQGVELEVHNRDLTKPEFDKLVDMIYDFKK